MFTLLGAAFKSSVSFGKASWASEEAHNDPLTVAFTALLSPFSLVHHPPAPGDLTVLRNQIHHQPTEIGSAEACTRIVQTREITPESSLTVH